MSKINSNPRPINKTKNRKRETLMKIEMIFVSVEKWF